jgi:hypothetical protein
MAVGAETTMRLRIAWGGGAPRRWHGTLRLSQGTLSEVRALGSEGDEPGSMWIDRDAVIIEQRSARADDGLDVLATAELDSRLLVELVADNAAAIPNQTIEIPLSDLVAKSHTTKLDETGSRLLAMRSPGDRLRVHLERSSLVFAPGERLELQVEPHLLGLAAGASLRLRASLAGAGGAKIWSQDYDTHVASDDEPNTTVTIETDLPPTEGVYDLSLTAVGSRAPWAKPLAERKVQMVVVAERPPEAASAAASFAKVLELDPANPRWYERLTSVSLLPGLRKGPLGSGGATRWEHPQLGPLTQLAAATTHADLNWEAYPLPVTRPHQTHILEVEYPSDVAQTLGISLVEPNAAGLVTPIGLDSGVYVSDDQAQAPPRLLKHHLAFWPRTKSPLLLLTNRRSNSRAAYGKIRVLGPAVSQLSTLGLSKEPRTVLPRLVVGSDRSERLLAAYFDRPLWNENFSATDSLDPVSRRSLDDWTTFYEGGSRLIEYLHYQGYNAAVLNVLDAGSTIYPSQLVEPTPQHDTGAYFSSGQDPLRKDALELLLRLFDREGLQLVPALDFSAPLPPLEELRRESELASGLEWVGPEGPPKRNSLAGVPRYNPLHPKVQEAMLAVVGELAQRYGGHQSFAGMALRLSAEGYAQLPAEPGSFDDHTIGQFERETKTKVPGSGTQRFAERARYLSGPGAAKWLAWRAGRLAQLHRAIYRELANVRGDARLYLATASLVDSPALARGLGPRCRRAATGLRRCCGWGCVWKTTPTMRRLFSCVHSGLPRAAPLLRRPSTWS